MMLKSQALRLRKLETQLKRFLSGNPSRSCLKDFKPHFPTGSKILRLLPDLSKYEKQGKSQKPQKMQKNANDF